MSSMHAPTQPIAGFALLVCLFCTLGLAATQAAEPAIPWPTRAWPTSTPEAQGMASAALAEMVDAGAAGGMDSLLVVRHGHIVAEAYYAPFQPQHRHLVNSVTKSVMGTLTGIAFQQGVLERPDQPVFEFFPERAAASLDAAKKGITLQHLLDMNSGLAWVEPLASAARGWMWPSS